MTQALNHLGIDPTLLDIRAPDFLDRISSATSDVVFITNQGAYGEDGKLQGLLELLDLRYVGSGVAPSAIGMDKLASKLVFKSLGLRVPDYEFCSLGDHPSFRALSRNLGCPFIVKPLMSGGSFGTALVKNERDFEGLIERMGSEFGDLLIEQYINGLGHEYYAGVLEDDVVRQDLPVCEILYDTGFFSNAAKYKPGLANKRAPALLDSETTAKLQAVARTIHTALGCVGMSRIDALIDTEGQLYVLELNTLPGLLPLSAFPLQCKASGVSYVSMVAHVLKAAFRRRPHEIPKLATPPAIPTSCVFDRSSASPPIG